jgi:hypothetical protein
MKRKNKQLASLQTEIVKSGAYFLADYFQKKKLKNSIKIDLFYSGIVLDSNQLKFRFCDYIKKQSRTVK